MVAHVAARANAEICLDVRSFPNFRVRYRGSGSTVTVSDFM